MNVTCMIRIVLADDHLVVRQGVRQMLAGVPNCQVVAEAADSRELLKLLRSQPVDVLILDMSMPGRNGIELIRQIKDGWPRGRVEPRQAGPCARRTDGYTARPGARHQRHGGAVPVQSLVGKARKIAILNKRCRMK